MPDWVRVFEKEMSRRHRLAAEEPQLYTKTIAAFNPKGLLVGVQCKEHCWVPATHLMIHDKAGRSYKIGGLVRRAFNEALPFTEDGLHIVPQICWRCDSHREKEIDTYHAAEIRKKFDKNRPRKRKGRVPEEPLSIMDDLFEASV